MMIMQCPIEQINRYEEFIHDELGLEDE